MTAGRAEVGLADAARAAIAAWHAYADNGDYEPGHPGPVEAAVTRLADALAEIGAATTVDMADKHGRPRAYWLNRALRAAQRDGTVTVLTEGNDPPVLVIPAGTAREQTPAAR